MSRLRISDLYWSTDDQLVRLEPRVRTRPRRTLHCRPAIPLSGIVFVDRNGLRSINAPGEYSCGAGNRGCCYAADERQARKLLSIPRRSASATRCDDRLAIGPE